MKSETVTLPAFLAPALINGDTSGLQTAEERAAQPFSGPREHAQDDFAWLEAAIKYCAPGRIVSCEGEPYFAAYYSLPGMPCLGMDVLDYVVLYPEEG